jgi:hypothetical protein
VAGNNLIWPAGTTVEYYVKVTDDFANVVTFPAGASDPENPEYFDFSALPFGNTTDAGDKILLVDDFERMMLDFENSLGFNRTGGIGAGDFDDPIFEFVDVMTAEALATIFGGDLENPKWDKYDVAGAGTLVQCEPNGVTRIGEGVGGYMNDLGEPSYDAIIWLQGDHREYTFAEATRLELTTYLDNGGHLFASGDNIAWALGAGGRNEDPLFLDSYLGASFPVGSDDCTASRILNTMGVPGDLFSGVELGLYGECPLRRCFDLMVLAEPQPSRTNAVVMTYQRGGPGDNGRASLIRNVRDFGGMAFLSGFGISALLSHESRVCVLHKILTAPTQGFGFAADPLPADYVCLNGVGAPVLAETHYGFSLGPAAPTPFSASTTIDFSVAARTPVTLIVYDVAGRRVCTLVDAVLPAGRHQARWEGCTDAGEHAASGVYFYRLEAGTVSETRKTLLLR